MPYPSGSLTLIPMRLSSDPVEPSSPVALSFFSQTMSFFLAPLACPSFPPLVYQYFYAEIRVIYLNYKSYHVAALATTHDHGLTLALSRKHQNLMKITDN